MIRKLVMLLLGSYMAVGIGLVYAGDFKYDPHGKRDPMIPVVDKDGNVLFQQDENSGKKVLALRLQGIIFREDGKSKAIIEGKIYKEGDKVSGFWIKKILKDKVILTDGKDDYELFMTKK